MTLALVAVEQITSSMYSVHVEILKLAVSMQRPLLCHGLLRYVQYLVGSSALDFRDDAVEHYSVK